MKKALLLLTVMIGVGCSNSESEIENLSNVNSNRLAVNTRFHPSKFDFIGTQHNDIMLKLEKALVEGSTTPTEFQLYADKTIYNEVEGLYTNPDDLSLAKNLIYTNLHTKPLLEVTPAFGYNDDKRLSFQAKNYLNVLQNIMMEDDAELTHIVSNINSLEMDAYNDTKLSNEDLLVLFPATSVAKHSIAYWNDHYDIWDSILNDKDMPITTAKTKPGKAIAVVATADVGGAVSGALGAWAVNVWVGPGQAAYAAAIVSTAVSCSAAATIGFLAEAIFNW